MMNRRQLGIGLAGTILGATLAPRSFAAVREVETLWIPMPDGARLAARAWIPEEAAARPVPAVVEFLPYRRRDFTRASDESMHPQLAARGYACLRVDLRGSGDSSGDPLDEYAPQEQDDGVAVIEWVAAQRWCSGRVGLTGISWGGINALQIAARRPRGLAAVIAHCFTTDRYAGDIHYKGGCVLSENVFWATVFLATQALPPDPAVVGTDWLRHWRERLDRVMPHLPEWLRHQRRDAFWRHGSVAHRYSDIRCPVYAIGGLSDPYARWVFDVLEKLDVPRRGLIGPWGHSYPHVGAPGPPIDYISEAVRWWDEWLKGDVTGIMNEPMLRVWMQNRAPIMGETEVGGRWTAERSWPSPGTRTAVRHLAGGRLTDDPAVPPPHVLPADATVGVAAGRWLRINPRTDLPWDQSIDDARSACFDSEPLRTSLEVLGVPVVTLEVAADRPIAHVAVRLNEVTPDGASRRVSFGVLNLCHRASDETPEPLVPGQRYRVRIELDPVAHRFAPGRRLRVAVSAAYWPIILPAPQPVTLTLHPGGVLELPERFVDAESVAASSFGQPAELPQRIETGPAREPEQRVEWDALRGVQRIVRAGGGYSTIPETGSRAVRSVQTSATIGTGNPTSATVDCEAVLSLERRGWNPSVRAYTRLEISTSEFRVSTAVTATSGRTRVLERSIDARVPRGQV